MLLNAASAALTSWRTLTHIHSLVSLSSLSVISIGVEAARRTHYEELDVIYHVWIFGMFLLLQPVARSRRQSACSANRWQSLAEHEDIGKGAGAQGA